MRCDFDDIINLLNDYITYIDNWALCDLVCSNLHFWSNNTKSGLKFIKRALKSKYIWFNRVGFVLLLDYYINDDYIDFITYNCDDINTTIQEIEKTLINLLDKQ